MDLTAESMDLDAFETILKTDARVKMLYLIPTFQNPFKYINAIGKNVKPFMHWHVNMMC